MKKILLLAVCVVAVAGAYCQNYSVMLYQTFQGTTAGWTTKDNNGSGITWGYTYNNLQTTDFGPFSFIDTAQANRYAAAVGDQTTTVDMDLNSPVINCSGHDHVLLEWTQWWGVYILPSATEPASNPTVLVSTDGINWTTVYVALQSSTGENNELVDIDISAQAANQSTVYIKFNYTTTNVDIFWAIDNIKVSDYPVNDVEVASVDVAYVSGITNNYQVNCTFINKGSSALNNVTFNYSINGSEPVSETLTNFGLGPLQSAPYSFQTTAKVTQPGVYPVIVYSTLPNGVQDDNTSNDSASRTVMFLGNVPEKNVLLEEYTTGPCGFCPGAAVYLDQIEQLDTFVIPVALHTGFGSDAMTTAAITTFGQLFVQSAPEAAINRVYFPNNNFLAANISSLCGNTSQQTLLQNNMWYWSCQETQQQISPVGIVANNSYNPSTRELTLNILPTFYGPMTGDFRVGCYVIEDSLFGSQICYYYSSPTNTSVNPWYNQGTELNSSSPSGCSAEAEISNYVYNRVVRDFIGNNLSTNWGWGTPAFGNGIVTPVVDSQYIMSFQYTLPQAYNPAHVKLVAFVDQYNNNLESGQNQVLNTVQMPLNGIAANHIQPLALTAVNDVPKSIDKVSVYPNPATNQVYINYSIDEPGRVGFEVYTSMGQLVNVLSESTLGAGKYSAVMNTGSLANGLYFLTMKNDNATVETTRFVVSR